MDRAPGDRPRQIGVSHYTSPLGKAASRDGGGGNRAGPTGSEGQYPMDQQAAVGAGLLHIESGARAWSLLARHGWLAPVLIGLLALSINLAGNSGTGLWDRDEPRYAVAVREMRASGNWLIPTFNGEPRYHKPILIYWLMSLGTAIGGDNPFGVRLISALAGAGTCVLTCLLARRMLGARSGVLAGMMMAVAPIAAGMSKLATPDATLAFWIIGCQCCLWELARRPSKVLAGTFWGLLSLAFLTKGPIAPAFLLASGGAAWWWSWPAARVWKRLYPLRGLLGSILVTAPWYVAVAIVTRGDYLRFAVGNQIVQRVVTGLEEHGGFPGYYALLSIPAFYPWSALLPAALVAAWRRRKDNPNLVFLLGWVVGPWIFLECLQTRIIHYYLPAFPAWALLAAWLVEKLAAEEVTLRRWPLGRLGTSLIGGMGIALAVFLMAAAFMAPAHLRPPLGLLAAIVAAGTPTAMLWLHRGATTRATLALGGSWAVFMLVLCGWLLPAAERYRTSRNIGERLARQVARTGIEPVLMNYQEPGVIYAMKKKVATIGDFGGAAGLLACKHSFLTVLTPSEAREYRPRFGLDVETLEDIDAFSLTKGRKELFQLAIVRRAAAGDSAEESRRIGRADDPGAAHTERR
jgi:4-amino-4-deoxy-L-arabinose transferase-like glycosyltransferase